MAVFANQDTERPEEISGNDFAELITNNPGHIHNKIVHGTVDAANYDTQKYIHIENCVFKNYVNLQFGTVRRFKISNCNFDTDLYLDFSDPGSVINLEKVQVTNDLVISELKKGQLAFSHCSIKQKLIFQSVDEAEVYVNSTSIEQELRLDGIGLTTNFGDFRLSRCRSSKVFIDNSVALKSMFFYSGVWGTVSIGSQKIDQLEFHGPEIIFELLEFKPYSYQERVMISSAKISKLSMSNHVRTSGSFGLYDVSIEDEWKMDNSSPYDLKLLNVNLSKANVYLDNSLLDKAIFSNIFWPRRNILSSTIEDGSLKRAVSLRETYRQLKRVMSREGNHIDALHFYRNEMEAYKQQINKNADVEAQTKFIVWLSEWASDHGQDFVRPLKKMLLIHLGLLIILVALNYNNYSIVPLAQHDWNSFENLFGEYFKLLNPAHRSPNMKGIQLFIDFLMRLSSGFFIYHIIRASRKFAKV